MAVFAVFTAFLLVIAFALVLGAQAFDTFVNMPVFFADPPRSIEKYMSWDIAKRVPLYFARTTVFMLASALLALVAAIAHGGPIVLFVAAVLAFVYIALLFGFFIPTNRKLGFIAGGTKAATDDEIAGLARKWQDWNVLRLFLEAAGLIAAAISLYVMR